MATSGLLFVKLDIAKDVEADFNRIYDQEHIQELLAVPGIRSARRFKAVEGEPAYQAMYDLDSVDVLASPAFRQALERPSEWNTRVGPHLQNVHAGGYTQIPTDAAEAAPDPSAVKGTLFVGLQIGPEHDEEFNDWYNTEHVPFLSRVPGVLRARRFRPATAPWVGLDHAERNPDGANRYLAVYELTDPDVPLSEAWGKASNTPWSARLRRYYTRWMRLRAAALPLPG